MNTKKNQSVVSGFALVASLLMGCVYPMAQTPAGETPAPADQSKPANAPPQEAMAKMVTPTVAECKTLAQKAATSVPAAAGNDVEKQFSDTFQAYHETFRCCFDALYAPQAPRMNGQVALDFKVDHTGKLVSADVITTESNISMPEMHTCMLDIAKTLTYPRPANEMAVDYKRVFQFKARH